jgi:hypothetical protein
MTDLHQWCAGFGPTRSTLANVRRYLDKCGIEEPDPADAREHWADTLLPRRRRA